MKIAVLEIDAEIAALLSAGGQPELQLDGAWAAADNTGAWASVPTAVRLAAWEDVLLRDGIDCVLVGTAPAEISEEPLRRLVQFGIPVAVTFPACPLLLAYELEMSRVENQGRIAAWFPGQYHPFWKRLTELARAGHDGPLGRVDRILIDRELAVESSAPDWATAVRTALARDVVCLRSNGWLVRSVAAVGGVQTSARSVMLELDAGVAVQWSARAAARDRAEVTLVGDRGKARGELLGGGETAALVVGDAAQAEQIAGRPPREEWQQAVWNEPRAWCETCRDLEVLDAYDRSVRRRRTVDVNNEPPSEAESFKGVMAAGSCLLLTAVFVLVLALALFESFRLAMSGGEPAAEELGRHAWPLWLRLWPVYPMAAFLLLQALLLVAQRSPRGGK